MPNLVPPGTDQTEEDPMSPELRAQFRDLQRLNLEHRMIRKSSSIHDSKQNFCRGLHRPNDGRRVEDTDDETLSDQIDSRPRSLDSSDHVVMMYEDPVLLQMALSTAITAQHEIDTLVHGIRELESFISSDHGHDSIEAQPSEGPSRVTWVRSVHNGDTNSCVPFVDE